MRHPRRSLCATILVLEAVALGLTTPVLIAVAGVEPATGLAVGLGLAAACVLLAGLLRHEWAYWMGYAVQVAALALGVLIPMMIILGVIFGALWTTADWLGRKIARERSAAYAAWEAEGTP